MKKGTIIDFLNQVNHPTTSVLPLSAHLIENAYPLRYRVAKRDLLESSSDILCDQIRTIDNTRILPNLITTLSLREVLEVDKQMKIILNIEI